MKRFRITSLLLGAAALPFGLFAAEKKTADQPAESCCAREVTEETKSYPLKGVVQSWVKENEALLVKHEEIPGFMRAMTMMFYVDAEELPTLKAGDTISAMMKRSDTGAWLLEEVKVVEQ